MMMRWMAEVTMCFAPFALPPSFVHRLPLFVWALGAREGSPPPWPHEGGGGVLKTGGIDVSPICRPRSSLFFQVLDWSLKFRFFDLKKIKVFVLDEADVMIATQGHQVGQAALSLGFFTYDDRSFSDFRRISRSASRRCSPRAAR